MFAQEEISPLSTTLCFLLLKKTDDIFSISPYMLFSLKIIPWCQTLSRDLDISEKMLLTWTINSDIHFFCKKNNKNHQHFWKIKISNIILKLYIWTYIPKSIILRKSIIHCSFLILNISFKIIYQIPLFLKNVGVSYFKSITTIFLNFMSNWSL